MEARHDKEDTAAAVFRGIERRVVDDSDPGGGSGRQEPSKARLLGDRPIASQGRGVAGKRADGRKRVGRNVSTEEALAQARCIDPAARGKDAPALRGKLPVDEAADEERPLRDEGRSGDRPTREGPGRDEHVYPWTLLTKRAFPGAQRATCEPRRRSAQYAEGHPPKLELEELEELFDESLLLQLLELRCASHADWVAPYTAPA